MAEARAAKNTQMPMTHPVEVSERLTLEFPVEWYAVVEKKIAPVGAVTAYALFMFEDDARTFVDALPTAKFEVKKISTC